MTCLSGLKFNRSHSFHRYLIILLFCCSGVFELNAQHQNSRFEYLTTNEGLSSSRIWILLRDSKDYLWISTDLGLEKYDSEKVIKYRYDEKQPGSISSNRLTCIYEDNKKSLWFGTIEGLNLYDPVKDNFRVFKNIPADTNTLNSNYVSSITEDKNGNLWIITDGDCLNRWIPEKNSFIRYHFKSIRYNTVRPAKMIAVDSKGYLWIVSFDNGINRFDPISGSFTKFDDSFIDWGSNCYKSIYIDNQDKIWITTEGYGFISYNPGTDKFEQFKSIGNNKGPNKDRILDILPEDDHHLLLAVDQGGVNRFDKVSKTFEYIMYDESSGGGLNNNGTWCLHKDKEGILWVGTSGGGVNYYNPKSERFKLFKHNSQNSNSLSYNYIGCFYEDTNGLIWIGTDGGGVNVYNPETGHFTVYKNDPSNPYSIGGNIILSIDEDKYKDIWISSWDAGLSRFERKTGKFFRYFPEITDISNMRKSGKTIWEIKIDNNNNIWLGDDQAGIVLLTRKNEILKRFSPDAFISPMKNPNQLFSFYEDFENNFWFCTMNGLYFYDIRTDSIKAYSLPSNQIYAFTIDSDGNLWVGSSSSGIYYCTPDGTIIKTFTIADGLPSNSIRAIIEDNNRDIWISTTNGISRFNVRTNKFRNYSVEDGLQGNDFVRKSFLKTRKGEIYFGGYNGFNSFFPDSLKDNDFVPPVYITDFQIFNKPVVYGMPGSQFQTSISVAKEIELTWRQSVFSFSFNAINYTFPGKNQYAYKLDGFEDQWIYTDASRKYVTYTNLDPGDYTFKVKASNNDGVWNEEGVSLKIIILPPWWSTWWFRLIMIFTAISLFTNIFLSRFRQLKKQKVLLEKSVAIKTAELQEKNTTLEERQHKIELQSEELLTQKESLIEMNNELNELNISKDKFFSILAHDLRGPLSSFVGATEILSEDFMTMEKEDVMNITSSMKTSATNIYSLLENLLEWSRLMRGRMDFVPVKVNLKNMVEECKTVLSPSAEKKRIWIVVNIPDEMEVFADNHMLDGIIRNLVSNAIKFTPVGGKVSVTAWLKDDYSLEVNISDTGIGIPKEMISKLFLLTEKTGRKGTEGEPSSGLGLLLCKEFIEKHHGKIWVESEPGKGSIFKFILPNNSIPIQ